MRLALALLTTFCLLFQQAAVAASACVMDGSRAGSTSMSEACAGMDMARDAPALCRSHCVPDVGFVPDTRFPPLDFILLPTPSLALLVVRDPPGRAAPAITPVHRSDPPARLRFCRLLI
ncbi:MAG TPA: hypothetical protein PKC03_09020 [Dokdonella sp.]|jgi:hypothetical protein|nr:hypothetical protein [Dokdonella sp.]